MKNIHLIPTDNKSSNETWKNIIDYEGLYQVSNFGNVKSLGNEFTRKERLLKLSPQSKGYLTVVLQKNTTRKMVLVHRLVAEYFIPNIDNKPQVNHINGIKTDNRIENLEWVSHRENLNHAIENNLVLKGDKNPTSKLKENEVIMIHNLLSKGVCIKALSKKYNVSFGTISGIRSGRYWEYLKLPKIKGRASKTSLEDIITIEKFLSENRTINNIHEITGFSAHLIQRIKNGDYKQLKYIYEEFIQNRR
jgi:hypothetical protein